MCGKVNIDEIPKGLDRTALQRKVNVFTEGHTVKVMILDTDMQGEFCAAFKPGKYVFQVGFLFFFLLSLTDLSSYVNLLQSVIKNNSNFLYFY